MNKFKHIVIGGLPRSGTSMLRAMIGSHPDIAIYKWELPFWTEIYPRYKNKEITATRLKNLLKDLFDNYTIKKSDVPFTKDEMVRAIEKMKNPITLEKIYFIILNRYKFGRKRKIVGLKTPYNENFANEIFELFPHTKFVQVIRNPIDVGSSLKKAKEIWWGGKMSFFKHIYEWRMSAEKAKQNKIQYPDRYYVLRYEDIVSNPIKTMKSISHFLEIDYSTQMISMKGHPGWLGSNSSFNNDSSKAHLQLNQRYISDRQEAYYHKLLGSLLKEFGYVNHSLQISNSVLKLRFHLWAILYQYKITLKFLVKRTKLYLLIKSIKSLIKSGHFSIL